jgi:serine/threonine protein kinase
MNKRFKKIELIGRGISSIVYRGEDTQSATPIAIKVLNPNLNSDPVLVERFRRELQIAREIQDPHIISIFDFYTEGSEKFLVMELLDGTDLKSYILNHYPLSLAFVLSFMGEILTSIKNCHQKGVLHRDLKPQNIFVLKNQSPKILDFGISRMATQSEITVAGTALGSPEYMAPELFNLPFFDFRSDIYALGIIFFEMLTGQLPFQGDSIATLYQEHLTKPLPSIKATRMDVPEWLIEIILKMTSKEITARYQGIEEILYDLKEQKVLMNGLRKLRTKYCIKCGTQNAVPLQNCLQCGHSFRPEMNQEQEYSLRAPGFAQKGLKPFFTKVCGRKLPKLPNPQKDFPIVNGLTAQQAQLLVENARANGITLDLSKKEPRVSKVRKNFFYAIAIVTLLGWVIVPRPFESLTQGLIGAFLLVAGGLSDTDNLSAPLLEGLNALDKHWFFLLVNLMFFISGILNLTVLINRKKPWLSPHFISPVNETLDQLDWLTPYLSTIIEESNPVTKNQVIKIIEQYIYMTNHPQFGDSSIKLELQQTIVIGLEILQWSAYHRNKIEAQERLNACLNEISLNSNLLIGRHLMINHPVDPAQVREVGKAFRASQALPAASRPLLKEAS